ncbi:alpha-amylase-like [Antedon mediterranea]|uniref:alpha-amylase-like n=1 Tax=Antedon mediterranea TaxID=105859 RepID=UPI003AF9B887
MKILELFYKLIRFLGPNGFGGVQISPPNEHRILYQPDWDPNVKRPWYESYQPISYKLETRRGTRGELIDMVERCNKAGVRIYADVVANHMCGTDAGIGTGSAGSAYDTEQYSFSGVPFSSGDFNVPQGKCNSHDGQISNYGDPDQVRNCDLFGLMDLDLSKEYVRQKVADYLSDLTSIGIAGFRIDAAKHMWPADVQAILGKLKDLPTSYFNPGSRPFVYQEVIDLGGEAISSTEYTHLGRVTEFRYGRNVSEAFRDGGSNHISNYETFGSGWDNMVPEGDALAFIDNHDNQRGHGAGGKVVTHIDPQYYKLAVTYMLAWPYGVPRVMSSYDFVTHWQGPPSDGNYVTDDPPILQDGSCGGGWVCEHRWRAIKNMAKWRNIAGNEPVKNWWSNGNQQAAFSRGSKAFVALNRDDNPISAKLNTGLPSGEYCDLARGDFDDASKTCSGPTVTVDKAGNADIYVDNNSDEPVLILHVGAIVKGWL